MTNAMSETDLIPLVEALARSRVLCVGDVMLDHYVYGGVERISPEAPIPVLRVEREIRKLGGAGNVLSNLQALGAQGCFISVTGGDDAGREVSKLVAGLAGVEAASSTSAAAPPRSRRASSPRCSRLLRADREQLAPLEGARARHFQRMVRRLPHYQVTVLSDYAKGVLAEGVAARDHRRGGAGGTPRRGRSQGRGLQPLSRRQRGQAQPARARRSDQRPVGSEAEVIDAARALIGDHGFGAVLVSLQPGRHAAGGELGRHHQARRRGARGLRRLRRRRHGDRGAGRGARRRRAAARRGAARQRRRRHRRRQGRHRRGASPTS